MPTVTSKGVAEIAWHAIIISSCWDLCIIEYSLLATPNSWARHQTSHARRRCTYDVGVVVLLLHGQRNTNGSWKSIRPVGVSASTASSTAAINNSTTRRTTCHHTAYHSGGPWRVRCGVGALPTSLHQPVRPPPDPSCHQASGEDHARARSGADCRQRMRRLFVHAAHRATLLEHRHITVKSCTVQAAHGMGVAHLQLSGYHRHH